MDNHGTGGGFSRYLQGEVDIVDASRPAKPDEEAKAKAQGIEWTRFLVGYDGITVVVNPKNDFVKSLTVEQLKAIWAPDSKVKTWKDVDPPGPTGRSCSTRPTTTRGPSSSSPRRSSGKAKSQREDVQPSPDDNMLVKGVAGDPDGLGYFGYAYYAANQDKLRAVAVQNGPDAKPVMPSPETILDKTYSPAVPAAVHLREELGRPPARGRRSSSSSTSRTSTRSPTRADTSPRRPRTRRPTGDASKLLSGGDGGSEVDRRRRPSKEAPPLSSRVVDSATSHAPRHAGRALGGPFPLPARSGKRRSRSACPVRGRSPC